MNRVVLERLQNEWAEAMGPAMEALERGADVENPTLFVWSEGNSSQREPVASVEDAKLVIHAWTLADLIDPNAPAWNAFGLVEGSEYPGEDAEFEWYDDECRSITEVMDAEETGGEG
jgi:hypothetical protein